VTYRLSEAALQLALKHLCRYGDTDIFPHLPELAFFSDEECDVVTELTALDLDTYNPGGAIESLAPKGRLRAASLQIVTTSTASCRKAVSAGSGLLHTWMLASSTACKLAGPKCISTNQRFCIADAPTVCASPFFPLDCFSLFPSSFVRTRNVFSSRSGFKPPAIDGVCGRVAAYGSWRPIGSRTLGRSTNTIRHSLNIRTGFQDS
jgi:hypothetical protein